MVAIGHLIGYGVGALDLGRIFGTVIGNSQFKQLCVVAALAIIIAVGVTCWAVQERVLVVNEYVVDFHLGTSPCTEQCCRKYAHQRPGVLTTIMQIYTTTRNLPNRIQAICWIQFWSWIGWFPFLFYSTTWVGEIYLRYDAPAEVKESKDVLGNIGRIGSTALIIFSIVTFVGSLVLPLLVKSPEDEQPGFTPRPPASIAPLVQGVSKRKPSLLTAWTISHLIFASSMVFAPFVASLHSATLLVAICGM